MVHRPERTEMSLRDLDPTPPSSRAKITTGREPTSDWSHCLLDRHRWLYHKSAVLYQCVDVVLEALLLLLWVGALATHPGTDVVGGPGGREDGWD